MCSPIIVPFINGRRKTEMPRENHFVIDFLGAEFIGLQWNELPSDRQTDVTAQALFTCYIKP